MQGPHTSTTSQAYHVVTQEGGYLSPQSSRKHGERPQTHTKPLLSVHFPGTTEKCTTSTRHTQCTHHRSWPDPLCSCRQLPYIPLPPAARVIVLFSFPKPTLTWFLCSKRFADLFRVRNWSSMFFEGHEKLWIQACLKTRLNHQCVAWTNFTRKSKKTYSNDVYMLLHRELFRGCWWPWHLWLKKSTCPRLRIPFR